MIQDQSRFRLQVSAYRCASCQNTFYEIKEAELSTCPHCKAKLSGQELEEVSHDDKFEVCIDPQTGALSILNTETQQLLTPHPCK